jgi:uncharacterized protein YciI
MSYTHYVILLKKLKDLNEEIVRKHVKHLQALEAEEQLVFCGPFTDYDGGMLIIQAADKSEAIRIAESDPFVQEGYESYEIRTMEQSCAANQHLGMA